MSDRWRYSLSAMRTAANTAATNFNNQPPSGKQPLPMWAKIVLGGVAALIAAAVAVNVVEEAFGRTERRPASERVTVNTLPDNRDLELVAARNVAADRGFSLNGYSNADLETVGESYCAAMRSHAAEGEADTNILGALALTAYSNIQGLMEKEMTSTVYFEVAPILSYSSCRDVADRLEAMYG